MIDYPYRHCEYYADKNELVQAHPEAKLGTKCPKCGSSEPASTIIIGCTPITLTSFEASEWFEVVRCKHCGTLRYQSNGF